MASWPSSLPQLPLVDGYQEQAGQNVIRSQVDSGPMKRRRRFTTSRDRFQMVFEMESAELSIFKDFFRFTLAHGALSFDYQHPQELVPATFAFVGEPAYRCIGGTIWQVQCVLEREDRPVALVGVPVALVGRVRTLVRIVSGVLSVGTIALAGRVRIVTRTIGNLNFASFILGGRSVVIARVIGRLNLNYSVQRVAGGVSGKLSATGIVLGYKSMPSRVVARVGGATLTLL